MINLLSENSRRNLKIARNNVVLLKYNLLLIAALSVLFAIYLLLYMGLDRSKSEATSEIGENSKQNSPYNAAQEESNTYGQNLAIARTLLDNSISYTSLISAIAEAIPSGVILDSLSLKAESIGQPTVFSARAKTYQKAMELKQRFQDSKVFSNVSLQSVQQNDSGDVSSSAYPVTVTISANINRGFSL
jgi:Tfp pilus assembly protein PilN